MKMNVTRRGFIAGPIASILALFGIRPKPDRIVIKGSPTFYYYDENLKAVVQNSDGKIEPIDELRFKREDNKTVSGPFVMTPTPEELKLLLPWATASNRLPTSTVFKYYTLGDLDGRYKRRT